VLVARRSDLGTAVGRHLTVAGLITQLRTPLGRTIALNHKMRYNYSYEEEVVDPGLPPVPPAMTEAAAAQGNLQSYQDRLTREAASRAIEQATVQSGQPKHSGK